MPTDRMPDREISDWLEADAPAQVPDRVLGATFERTRRTRQQARWRTVLGRYPMVRMPIAVAATAAVAIAATAVLGLVVNPSGGVGGPQATPSASPTLTASPRVFFEGEMEPGTYAVRPLAAPDDDLTVVFTVPDGWTYGGSVMNPTGNPGTGAPGGMAIQFLDVTTLNSDPCRWEGPDEVTAGSTVDDLVEALEAQTTYETSEPTDVTIGGYSGKRVDIVSPAELFADGIGNAPSCDSQRYRLWGTSPGGEEGVYVQGPANRWQTNVLDVDGTRLVIVVQDFPGTSPADRAVLDAIIESIDIEP